jgi:hypothetical protein
MLITYCKTKKTLKVNAWFAEPGLVKQGLAKHGLTERLLQYQGQTIHLSIDTGAGSVLIN